MRIQVLDSIQDLADPDWQERVWIRRQLPHPNYIGSLKLIIDILFDDTVACEDPFAMIGITLHNEAEAEACKVLGDAMERVFADVGVESDDETMMRSSGWPAVVEAAKRAAAVMTEPSK